MNNALDLYQITEVCKRLGSASLAAWVQAIGSILAIGVAIAIPLWNTREAVKLREENNRKIIMSAAANLEIALSYQSAVFAFSPTGNDKIGHDPLTLDQARQFLHLQLQTHEALEKAIEKSHYFSYELCEQVVRLGIESASYERLIDDFANIHPNMNADTLFLAVNNTKDRLNDRIIKVRELLQNYLPEST